MKSKITSASEEVRGLFKLALAVREKAHCPYSHFKVGAAIRTTKGQIFYGCNVENASYGGSICAERTAIVKAASEVGKFEIAEVLVVTDARDFCPPCGMCLQVIAEFSENPTLFLSNLNGDYEQRKFNDVFPFAFRRSFLVKE